MVPANSPWGDVCRDGSCVLPHTERSRPSNCQNLSVYRGAHTCWWSMNQIDFISSTWLPLTNLIHKEALRVYLLFHCAAYIWTVFIMKMTHNRTWTLLLHICASVFLISLIHHSTDKSPLVTYKQNTAITLLPQKKFFFKAFKVSLHKCAKLLMWSVISSNHKYSVYTK